MNATITQLTDHLLSLPVHDRVTLAQKLWESIEFPELQNASTAADPLALARMRSAEVEAGTVQTIPHDKVMQEARETLRCE